MSINDVDFTDKGVNLSDLYVDVSDVTSICKIYQLLSVELYEDLTSQHNILEVVAEINHLRKKAAEICHDTFLRNLEAKAAFYKSS